MNKRILIVIDSLKRGGGAERSAARIGSCLNERNHEIVFLTFLNEGPSYDFIGEKICLDEISVINKYPYLDILKDFIRGGLISRICKNEYIDIIISLKNSPNISSLFSKIIFGNKAKIIVSERVHPLVYNKRYEILKKIMYPRADKVVAVSKRVESVLKREFSLENTTTIYNPIDSDRFKKQSQKDILKKHKAIFNSDEFNFINIGRLSKLKGQFHLIRSFKKLTEKNKEAKLIILGEGNLREDLKKLIEELGLTNKIFLLGNVNNVFPYLKKSDCFVFTSLSEGFPNVLIEALSQELPIISTDCKGGVREILCPQLELNETINYPFFGKYGILVKPFDMNYNFKTIEEIPLSREEKLLAKIMKKMIENNKLRNKYSKGLTIETKLDINNIMQDWENII